MCVCVCVCMMGSRWSGFFILCNPNNNYVLVRSVSGRGYIRCAYIRLTVRPGRARVILRIVFRTVYERAVKQQHVVAVSAAAAAASAAGARIVVVGSGYGSRSVTVCRPPSVACAGVCVCTVTFYILDVLKRIKTLCTRTIYI